ncbi:unnamed protein product [Polarella glacialis]|uniref:Uncharacterized protein n=1 Tax=Polarella glacialis TaxID=89957 RepID=A0A813H8Y3_POLGL|nr:unnamed protein product [Polarella glacialis]
MTWACSAALWAKPFPAAAVPAAAAAVARTELARRKPRRGTKKTKTKNKNPNNSALKEIKRKHNGFPRATGHEPLRRGLPRGLEQGQQRPHDERHAGSSAAAAGASAAEDRAADCEGDGHGNNNNHNNNNNNNNNHNNNNNNNTNNNNNNNTNNNNNNNTNNNNNNNNNNTNNNNNNNNTNNNNNKPSVKDVLRELRGMPQAAGAPRIRQLTVEVLRKLAVMLQADQQSDNDSDSDVDVAPNAALCEVDAGKSESEEEDGCAGSSKSDSDSQESAFDLAAEQRPIFAICDSAVTESTHDKASPPTHGRMRGVTRSHDGLISNVGLEGILICTQVVHGLDVAIDMHISLVYFRQLVRMHLEEGMGLQDAMRHSIQAIEEERRASNSTRIRFRFRSKHISQGWAKKSSQSLDEFFLMYLPKDGRPIKPRKRKETLSSEERQRVAEQKQHRAQEKQRRREERQQKVEEKRCRADQRQRKNEEKLRVAQLAVAQARAKKRHWLRERVLAVLRQAEQAREKAGEKALRSCWGVKELPLGVELATLRSPEDCVCAVLRLKDNTTRSGPFRQTLAEAKTDLADLQQIQRLMGDEAVCREAEQRDLDAMAALFMQQVSSCKSSASTKKCDLENSGGGHILLSCCAVVFVLNCCCFSCCHLSLDARNSTVSQGTCS